MNLFQYDDLTDELVQYDNLTDKQVQYDDLTDELVQYDDLTDKLVQYDDLTDKLVQYDNLTDELVQYDDLMSRGKFSREDVVTMLTAHQGDTEAAFQVKIIKKHFLYLKIVIHSSINPFKKFLNFRDKPQRMRLQRRLYEIYTVCLFTFTIPCNCKLFLSLPIH